MSDKLEETTLENALGMQADPGRLLADYPFIDQGRVRLIPRGLLQRQHYEAIISFISYQWMTESRASRDQLDEYECRIEDIEASYNIAILDVEDLEKKLKECRKLAVNKTEKASE